MVRPCPTKIGCLDCGDGPLANLSAEAPDLALFVSTAYFQGVPPLGTSWEQVACGVAVFSDVSQADADAQALAAAEACAEAGWTNPVNGNNTPDLPPVPPPQSPAGGLPFGQVGNTPQIGTADCPDGSPFLFPVPAGMFFAKSQSGANNLAIAYGNDQAKIHLLCLSDLPDQVCLNVAVNETITATSTFLGPPGVNVWTVSGGLTDGLTFAGPDAGPATLTGTPTTPGVYSFIIGVTLPNGDFNFKEYGVAVAGITNGTSLPNATVGVAYSATLVAVGFTNPDFTVSDVPLPDGLSLDSAGNITGTPANDAATTTFPVFVRDTATDFICSQDVTINVTSINYNGLVWQRVVAPPDDPGTTVLTPNPPVGSNFNVTTMGNGSLETQQWQGNINIPDNTKSYASVLTIKTANFSGTFMGPGGQDHSIQIYTWDGVAGPFTLIAFVDLDPTYDVDGTHTFNIPFTVPITTDSQVVVEISLDFANAGPSSTVSFVFTPAS